MATSRTPDAEETQKTPDTNDVKLSAEKTLFEAETSWYREKINKQSFWTRQTFKTTQPKFLKMSENRWNAKVETLWTSV